MLGEEEFAALQKGANWGAKANLDIFLSELEDRAQDQLKLGLLIRVFALGESISLSESETAFSGSTAAGLQTLGIISINDQQEVRAALSLTPHTAQLSLDRAGASNTLWILSDLDDHLRGGSAPKDHVMGIGGATRSLISAIPKESFAETAEIGTGNGIVALELASISNKVIATDISSRALQIARLNATLNEITNIDFVHGSLFEPLAKNKFDLVVSNPPFVIAPEGTEGWEYRSGGDRGDNLLRKIVADVAAHLKPNGLFVALGNWEHEKPSAEADLFQWIIERGSQSTLEYVDTWLRDGGMHEGTEEHKQLRRLWLNDFSSRGVARVSYGYIFMRQQSLQIHRHDHVSLSLGNGTRFGDTATQIISAVRALHSLTEEEILESFFLRDDSVYELRTLVPGTEQLIAINLLRQNGIERQEQIGTVTAAVVGACDGELTLGQIIRGLSVVMQVDEVKLREEVLLSLEELVWAGFIAPQTLVELN